MKARGTLVAHDLLWFFSFFPKTCSTGCASQDNSWSACFHSKIQEYCHRVELHSCHQSLLHRFHWMVDNEVSALIIFQKKPHCRPCGVSSPCRWFDCVFICAPPFSFYDGVIGIVDPEKFIPPSFCEDAKLEMQEPVHFFHFFEKKV